MPAQRRFTVHRSRRTAADFTSQAPRTRREQPIQLRAVGGDLARTPKRRRTSCEADNQAVGGADLAASGSGASATLSRSPMGGTTEGTRWTARSSRWSCPTGRPRWCGAAARRGRGDEDRVGRLDLDSVSKTPWKGLPRRSRPGSPGGADEGQCRAGDGVRGQVRRVDGVDRRRRVEGLPDGDPGMGAQRPDGD